MKVYVLIFWNGPEHPARKLGHDIFPVVYGVYKTESEVMDAQDRLRKEESKFLMSRWEVKAI